MNKGWTRALRWDAGSAFSNSVSSVAREHITVRLGARQLGGGAAPYLRVNHRTASAASGGSAAATAPHRSPTRHATARPVGRTPTRAGKSDR